jgi:hypothetical protein
LDCDESVGKYEVDGYAFLYAQPEPPKKKDTQPDPTSEKVDKFEITKEAFGQLTPLQQQPYVRLLRDGMNMAAQRAATKLRIRLEDNLVTRKFAQRFLATLAKIEKLTAWLPHDDPTKMAADLSRVFEALPTEPAVPVPRGRDSRVRARQSKRQRTTVTSSIVSIMDGFQLVRALRERPLVELRSNNFDIAINLFVEEAIDFHEHYTGKLPPKSRSSDFAHLVAAAWLDLRLPVPHGKDGRPREFEDLAAFFGYKIERVLQPQSAD